jgi:HD superfamily hydrolase
MIGKFFEDTDISKSMLDRIDFMIAHHHTYTDIDGIDLQILLEADFLVNADEMKLKKEAIEEMMRKVFKTETGIRYLKALFSGR